MDSSVDLSALFGNTSTENTPPPSFAASLASTGSGVDTRKTATSTDSLKRDSEQAKDSQSIDWNNIIKDVGKAQNLSFCTSQLAGSPLANTLASSTSKALGSGAAAIGSSLGNPFVGSAVGSLAGAYVTKATSDSTSSAIKSVTSHLDLQPTQKLLGQGLTFLNKTEKAFGFLYPAATDPKTTSVVQLDTALAHDANIVYKEAPTLPVLTHHNVKWLSPIPGETPVTGVRRSQALSSRMSFTIPERGMTMSLLVNPKSINVNRSQTMSTAVSRSGHIVNPTGPGEFDVSISGTTAAFYESLQGPNGITGGLSYRETYTVGYSNLVLLYNFFLNNGYFLDDEAHFQSKQGNVKTSSMGVPQANLETPPTHRINSLSYVSIEWQKWVWNGFFKDFKIHDSAENPYTLNFEFTFRVCQEADKFSIDNTKFDNTSLIMNATGHVVEGFCAERDLATQSVSGSHAGAASMEPVHRNTSSLFSFEDTSDPVTTSLNPTIPLDEVARRLSLGGYSITTLSGPDGDRVFGTASDGTALDLNGKDSGRSLTMALPGGSPVKYMCLAEQDTANTVKGIVKIEPCGESYSYKNVPGNIAK